MTIANLFSKAAKLNIPTKGVRKNEIKRRIADSLEEIYGKRKKAGLVSNYNPIEIPLEACFNR